MTIVTSRRDRVLVLEISRQPKRNTLDAATLRELALALEEAQNDGLTRALAICAQPGLFSAGSDIDELLHDAGQPAAAALFEAMRACRIPLLACVQGPAVGLAVTLLLYCDLVYCGRSALFSLPFTALGLTPRFGTATRLVHSAGLHKAAEKLLLSEPVSADEALAMGLVSGVYADDAVLAQTMARADRLAKLPPAAVAGTLGLLRALADGGDGRSASREEQAWQQALASGQAHEACRAFLEGRRPEF